MAEVVISEIDVLGIPGVQAELDRITTKLSDMSEALVESVHAVAGAWNANYVSEGRDVGGWPALAEKTIERRNELGYGDGPIMQRSGSLFDVAIAYFQSVDKHSSGRASTDPEGTSTTATFDVNGSTAELHVSGKKVANQDGGGRLPPRPFWFTDGYAPQAAQQALVKWLQDNI